MWSFCSCFWKAVLRSRSHKHGVQSHLSERDAKKSHGFVSQVYIDFFFCLLARTFVGISLNSLNTNLQIYGSISKGRLRNCERKTKNTNENKRNEILGKYYSHDVVLYTD